MFHRRIDSEMKNFPNKRVSVNTEEAYSICFISNCVVLLYRNNCVSVSN
jgi:hypothetical protein